MVMSHDEMIAVIQAHKDGASIQCRRVSKCNDTPWVPVPQPRWKFTSCEYRVTPTPATVWEVLD